MTPYASKVWGARWYKEQEEYSHPYYMEVGGSEERILLPLMPMGRTLMRTRVPQSTHRPSKRPEGCERIGRFHTTSCNILMEIKASPMLRRPKPIDTPPKFRNKNKYCKYYEDHRHTTVDYSELKKALHELADQGQLNRFLKKGGGGDHKRRNLKGKKDNDADHNTKIITTITREIDSKKLSTGYRKA
ncbi:hypothetical protein Cgig2_022688 [Carnegiea gigantea]|uniref:Uncharacterized protein n=1 Tax=Carnegiea gigantea TaxID=171969 RepID=A0A9Q1K9N6_9CARY|nr:hypothetical protein Cgig2_022688 [Carnegiea gigantea]